MNKMISDLNVMTSVILCFSLLYHYSHLCSSPVSEGNLVLCSQQHSFFFLQQNLQDLSPPLTLLEIFVLDVDFTREKGQ